jgi:ERCC4-type nuclease
VLLVVVVDVHERRSGIPARLERLGACVEVRALTSGDDVLGPGTVVERKTVLDLHRTILAERFWTQMRNISRAGRAPYLVIEGRSIYHGEVRPSAVRGLCLAAQDLGVAIVRSADVADLRTIPGVGIRRAEAVVALIRSESPGDSPN